MKDTVRYTVRMSREQAARVAQVAALTGMTVNSYIASAAVAATVEADETASLKRAVIDAIGEASEAMQTSLHGVLDEHDKRQQKQLFGIADWMQKRWPQSVTAAHASKPKAQEVRNVQGQ